MTKGRHYQHGSTERAARRSIKGERSIARELGLQGNSSGDDDCIVYECQPSLIESQNRSSP
jgi:hypothetical protein